MARRPLTPERAFPVTAGAPHVRGFWTLDRVTFALLAALAPSFVLAVAFAGTGLLAPALAALGTVCFWQFAFSRWARRPMTPSGVVTALVISVLVPPSAPLWQIALAASFGIVIGEQIFGGRGRNFVSPATLALAFLMFSFPDAGYDQAGIRGWEAPLAGGVLLAALGLLSWRIAVSGLLAALATALALGVSAPAETILSGSFLFALVFLAGDPVAAPDTNPGRWIYGLVIGGLAMLGAGALKGIIFACLIGSIFAPLIDQIVIWAHLRNRRRRHDRA
ncbi:MAG: RnfABCDGE type electron transport complex subunit D [Alphaproteobacteria bacterium]|nr:RnfABCDGE type electron transport complex subunit D [Alphaproteobacteria bacterium]